MSKIISSLQNPWVKNLLLLQEKPRARKEQNLIVIEGIREVTLARDSGFAFTLLFCCPDLLTPEELQKIDSLAIPEQIEVPLQVFDRMAYRKGSGGVIGLARPKRILLDDLKISTNPLILVLETVEKPGNLGALLRTADAANLDAVIVCDPQTDIYNPNSIRSSVGCLFTLPVVTTTTDETIGWLKKKKIRIFGTALTSSRFYHDSDYRQPSAIVMGTEATGLSRTWLDQCDELIKIPMMGKVDSMNVSVSAAIVVFEAMRQRNFNR